MRVVLHFSLPLLHLIPFMFLPPLKFMVSNYLIIICVSVYVCVCVCAHTRVRVYKYNLLVSFSVAHMCLGLTS